MNETPQMSGQAAWKLALVHQHIDPMLARGFGCGAHCRDLLGMQPILTLMHTDTGVVLRTSRQFPSVKASKDSQLHALCASAT